MGGLIFLALLVGVMVLFPFLAIVIIPFIVISVLIGLGIRSIGGSMTEPIRSEVRDSAERIAEAIESLRSEHDHLDTEPEDEDESETEPEIDPPVTKELMKEIESLLQEGSTGDLSIVEIKNLRLPQFSNMSFVSKIRMLP